MPRERAATAATSAAWKGPRITQADNGLTTGRQRADNGLTQAKRREMRFLPTSSCTPTPARHGAKPRSEQAARDTHGPRRATRLKGGDVHTDPTRQHQAVSTLVEGWGHHSNTLDVAVGRWQAH